MCSGKENVYKVRISLLNESTKTATVDLCETCRQPMVRAMDAKPVGVRQRRAVTPKKEVATRRRAPARKKS